MDLGTEIARLGGYGAQVGFVAKVAETFDQATGDLRLVLTVEVVSPEILVLHAVAQHVVAGGEHRSGDGDDGLLRAAPSFEPEKLGSKVAVLLASCGPGGSDEGRLEPSGSFRNPSGSSFAGALIVPRAEPRPGDEVTSGREARHVDADLRHDDACGDVTDPRHRRQQGGARLDRLQGFSHADIHLVGRLLQGVEESNEA